MFLHILAALVVFQVENKLFLKAACMMDETLNSFRIIEKSRFNGTSGGHLAYFLLKARVGNCGLN